MLSYTMLDIISPHRWNIFEHDDGFALCISLCIPMRSKRLHTILRCRYNNFQFRFLNASNFIERFLIQIQYHRSRANSIDLIIHLALLWLRQVMIFNHNICNSRCILWIIYEICSNAAYYY